jgi:hypothetical protein
MRPRWALRYLTRFGISMATSRAVAPGYASARWVGRTSPLKIHTLTPMTP